MRASTGNLVAICIAFAVTAFLGGMAASIVFGGDDKDSGGSAVIQPTQAPVNRTPGVPVTGSVVPIGSPVQTLPTQPPVAPTTPPQPTAPPQVNYTVVSGDTLTGIAVKQNIPVDQRTAWIQQVRTLNSITGDAINIGQVLKLPPAAGAAAAPAATTPAAPVAGATVVGTPRPPAATTPAAGGAAPATTATRTP